MRAFVAIELPLSMQTALASVGAQLRAALPDLQVRWVAPTHIHLTIKFLGEVSHMQADTLAGDLLALAVQLPPIQLSLGEVGCFSQRGMPRALWVGLSGGKTPLNGLQRAVEAAALARGHQPETRAFRPHLTLGRLGTRQIEAAAGKVSAALQKVVMPPSGDWIASEFSLIRSDLLATGAKYTALRKFAFGWH